MARNVRPVAQNPNIPHACRLQRLLILVRAYEHSGVLAESAAIRVPVQHVPVGIEKLRSQGFAYSQSPGDFSMLEVIEVHYGVGALCFEQGSDDGAFGEDQIEVTEIQALQGLQHSQSKAMIVSQG
jgi:hypothetical protein